MARAKQPVSINGIEFDALISEDNTFTANVPQYAVEDGFSVCDTIILEAEALSMVLYLTPTPVTWYKSHGPGESRVNNVIKKLKELYYAKEPVSITTTDSTFTDMAIESLTISKSAEVGYAREIPISFKKIRKTAAKTTSIPASYGKSGTTGANAGTANTSTGTAADSGAQGSGNTSASSTDGSKSSVLYGAAASAGLI
ncbi:MAG: hypothetical protein NC452_02205 [Eubacterium sp.]|nr:hypothetical protein [Eubacterium sp.]